MTDRAAAIALWRCLNDLERYLQDTPHHNAVQAAAARQELNKWADLFSQHTEQVTGK